MLSLSFSPSPALDNIRIVDFITQHTHSLIHRVLTSFVLQALQKDMALLRKDMDLLRTKQRLSENAMDTLKCNHQTQVRYCIEVNMIYHPIILFHSTFERIPLVCIVAYKH